MDWKPSLTNILQTLAIVGGVVAFLYSNAHKAQEDYGSVMVRLGNLETRQTNDEQRAADHDHLNEQFVNDTRGAWEHISEQLADIRVQMAKMQKGSIK